MESMRCSQASLVLGIALGVGALCMGMMPLNIGSGSVFGGYFEDALIEGHWVAVDSASGGCQYCSSASMRACSEYLNDGNPICTGGWAVVATCGGSWTTHATGLAGCLGHSYCTDLYDATCTYD